MEWPSPLWLSHSLKIADVGLGQPLGPGWPPRPPPVWAHKEAGIGGRRRARPCPTRRPRPSGSGPHRPKSIPNQTFSEDNGFKLDFRPDHRNCRSVDFPAPARTCRSTTYFGVNKRRLSKRNERVNVASPFARSLDFCDRRLAVGGAARSTSRVIGPGGGGSMFNPT